MRTNSKISAYILRSATVALLLSCVIVALSSAINLPNHPPKVSGPPNNTAFGVIGQESASSTTQRNRTLTFADRVAYQRAIEEVYWRHRIWPKANAGPKPSLDKVVSHAQIEKKVEDYLRNSQALEDYWQRPITPDQLQAEMERMASHTKQPEVLRELFAALGNDPFVIAECLARPVLAERLFTELYAHDERFHGELKRHAEAELRAHRGIGQMKQTSGMYTEMEWIKSDSAEDSSGPADTTSPGTIRMNGSEWQERVQKLAKDFGSTKFGRARPAGAPRHSEAVTPEIVGHLCQTPASLARRFAETPYKIRIADNREPGDQADSDLLAHIKTGVLSPLQENDGHYYAVAVMKKVKDRLKLATVAWLKEPLRSWLAKAGAQVPVTMAAVTGSYTLPVIGPSVACTDDAWTPTSLTNAPAARYRHTAVWTGSEMIVWGGYVNGVSKTGGRYNPSTDSWTATSTTNAPAAREFPTAVWTGSEMIVWGGSPYFFNTGGRYNPGTDSWSATSTTGAPSGREFHTAVWTGSEMIIWGGNGGDNTGGRYNPSTDSWTATSTTNAPAARWSATAVWTGSEMIVWGGFRGTSYFKTGGRYNPSTDSWTATSITGAPAGRDLHTAVWTGSEMIVWGGDVSVSHPSNTGGRYNPTSNSWTATSLTNAPDARDYHTAVWTGNEMIVWGGTDNVSVFNTGRRYNPGTDSWAATSTTNAPSAPELHTAVWTGSQMIVWGGGGSSGLVKTGGRYCAQSSPVITSPRTATTTRGQLFVYQIIATNVPTSYTATPLPAGMSFDNVTGILGGTPTSPGTTQIHLTATNSFGTGMKILTLTVRPPPSSGVIIASGTSVTARTGQPFSFEVFTSGGSSTARLSATGLPPGLSVDPATGVISGTPMVDGSFGVTLTVRDGAVTTTSTLELTFTSDPAIPVITSPRETALVAGQFFTYTITAPSSNHSGTTVSLIGNLPLGLGFHPATGTISGTFNPGDQNGGALLGNVQLGTHNSSGTATNPLSFFQAVSATAKNISTRLAVGTNDNVLIGGFIVTGNASKKVIVRAIGPELGAPPYNIPNALADPTLELRDHTGAVIASNDNWMDAQNKQEIINNTLAPTDSRESAMIVTLAPNNGDPASLTGHYTAIVRGKNGTTGVALVEVDDLGTASLDVSSNAQLGNISTRGLVQTGDNVMIGGFILKGDMPATVIVRAIGPSLTQYNVPNALQDPTLELRDHTGAVIKSNDNWTNDPGAAQIQMNHLAPGDPREAATIVTLQPGNYTVIVRGKNNTTGIALVEGYVLQ